jgi:cytosine/uracil/thiamine/allantoin permease
MHISEFAANSNITGADVTGLLPKVFTIVRGQLFCGIVSLAIVPWKLLSKTLMDPFLEHQTDHLLQSVDRVS